MYKIRLIRILCSFLFLNNNLSVRTFLLPQLNQCFSNFSVQNYAIKI